MNIADANGRTPLMIAARNCELRLVNTLLNAGADVNARDNYGNTALILTPRNNHSGSRLKMIKLLLISGAQINLLSNEDHNALTRHMSHNRWPPDYRLYSFLYAAGEWIYGSVAERMLPEERPEVPEDLQHLCREAIREHLFHLDPHTHLFGRISDLELPKSLISYMLFDVSLKLDQVSDQVGRNTLQQLFCRWQKNLTFYNCSPFCNVITQQKH